MLEDLDIRLNQLARSSSLDSLQNIEKKRLIEYFLLLMRWNARMNLTAVRDPDAILQRHFLESIACAQALPRDISTLLDFGSGAGFPGIPIAICRPEIAVTLAESQNKKAAFLREAVRVTDVTARIHSGRAETLKETFDCVTLRAVDQMEQAVASATLLLKPGGFLAPLTTLSELDRLQTAAGSNFTWSEPVALPGSEQRILALARRARDSAS
jgi:16S rRNA (guanine527-N7)-methyltransferase